MANNVLVAYGSKYGATKEIAEKIGEVLKAGGLPGRSAVRPTRPGTLQGIKAVVLAALYTSACGAKKSTAYIKKYAKSRSGTPTGYSRSGLPARAMR